MLLGFCFLGCEARADKMPPPAPPRAVEVLTVTASEVRETGEYLGTIVSRQSVDILPQVTGYVRQILVKPGQEVKAGETLVELDSRQEVAALQSADAQQKAAASNEELAQRTFERTQLLFKEGLVSGQELDRAQAAAKAAQAEARAAAARVAQQRVALNFHAVRAPFAGTVGSVAVRVGDYLSPTTPLLSITQGSMLEVEVTIPPERARRVAPGTPIELLDSAGKVLLTTQAYFVAPRADPRTQLVEVNAVFENTVGLRPSELVRTRIVYGTSKALQVPVLSIVRQSGQPFVFAVEDKPSGPVVTRRPVTLGPVNEQRYVVTKGLAEGDRIAVSSLQALRDGAPIEPLPPKQEQAAP